MLARRPFLRGCFLLSCVSVSRGAAAAPPSPAIIETPNCRVTLAKASYDDPDGDDAEFLEIFVERRVVATSLGDAGRPDARVLLDSSSPPALLQDGSGSSDSGVSTVRTLGDCALGSIELVNGGSGACDKYRTLLVADVPVPGDGYVVVCAVDSSLAAAGKCDASTFGQTTLKNGWLQNGPNDGIRFLGMSAELLLEVGYEGGPACFTNSTRLVDESGTFSSISGLAEDDVNVLCDGGYRLVAASSASLREPFDCTAGPSPDGGAADGEAAPALAAGGSAPWIPEYAPPLSSATGGAGATAGAASVSISAGGAVGKVPSAPSCSISTPIVVPRLANPMIALALCSPWFARIRRRKLRLRAHRARSRARSGSSHPR